ncbi:MAG: hypothetical protein K0B05_12710 [Bacteroidales bacterium]|nr:hypothetical protein [Bacteroidales bacterium]
MIKRTTAFAFLMLAGLLLLAHAVIPHHHHDKQICFVTPHCLHDESADEHDKNQLGHSHDEENDPDDCVLKNPVVLYSNQWRTDYKFYNISSSLSAFDDSQYSLLNGRKEFPIPVLSPFVYEHFTNCSYSVLVAASLGLRAPPVV